MNYIISAPRIYIYYGGDFGLAALFGNYIDFWVYINIYSRASFGSAETFIINYNHHSSSHKTSEHSTNHIILHHIRHISLLSFAIIYKLIEIKPSDHTI